MRVCSELCNTKSRLGTICWGQHSLMTRVKGNANVKTGPVDFVLDVCDFALQDLNRYVDRSTGYLCEVFSEKFVLALLQLCNPIKYLREYVVHNKQFIQWCEVSVFGISTGFLFISRLRQNASTDRHYTLRECFYSQEKLYMYAGLHFCIP